MNRSLTTASTMSSEISTEKPRLKADTGLQPWQLFVLAGLACATAVTFLVRDRGVTVVVLLSVILGATVLVGLAALRAVRPLVSSHDERSAVIGHRTRAALEQEKSLALRTIKELEFDRAMGKVSDEDFHEMSVHLRARAARLIRQLDAGVSYRVQIERELAKRLGDAAEQHTQPAAPTCARCSTLNDHDAKFCKACGARL